MSFEEKNIKAPFKVFQTAWMNQFNYECFKRKFSMKIQGKKLHDMKWIILALDWGLIIPDHSPRSGGCLLLHKLVEALDKVKVGKISRVGGFADDLWVKKELRQWWALKLNLDVFQLRNVRNCNLSVENPSFIGGTWRIPNALGVGQVIPITQFFRASLKKEGIDERNELYALIPEWSDCVLVVGSERTKELECFWLILPMLSLYWRYRYEGGMQRKDWDIFICAFVGGLNDRNCGSHPIGILVEKHEAVDALLLGLQKHVVRLPLKVSLSEMNWEIWKEWIFYVIADMKI